MQVEKLQMTPVSVAGAPRLVQGLGEAREPAKPFGQFLADALRDVNALQKQGEKLNADMAAGKVNDLSEVVVAGEKASIAIQLTTQMRNRMVEAYQEIMRMQV